MRRYPQIVRYSKLEQYHVHQLRDSNIPKLHDLPRQVLADKVLDDIGVAKDTAT